MVACSHHCTKWGDTELESSFGSKNILMGLERLEKGDARGRRASQRLLQPSSLGCRWQQGCRGNDMEAVGWGKLTRFRVCLDVGGSGGEGVQVTA